MATERTYLYDVLAVVLVGALIYGVYSYFQSGYSRSLEVRTNLQQEVGVKQGFSQTPDVDKISEYIESFIPTGVQKSQLTAEISQIANQSNVRINQIEFTEVESQRRAVQPATPVVVDQAEEIDIFKGTFKQNAVNLAVSGTSEAIQSFVEELVVLDRFVDIQTVSYSRVSGQEEITGSIGANVYYR